MKLNATIHEAHTHRANLHTYGNLFINFLRYQNKGIAFAALIHFIII